jgi:hypothetical protein
VHYEAKSQNAFKTSIQSILKLLWSIYGTDVKLHRSSQEGSVYFSKGNISVLFHYAHKCLKNDTFAYIKIYMKEIIFDYMNIEIM